MMTFRGDPMSLTATLLLNKPIRLPEGVKQAPHYLCLPEPLVTVAEQKYEKRKAIKEANIAQVLTAIKEGVITINEIAVHIGVSKSTVLKAVNYLQEREQIECTIGRNSNGVRVYHWRLKCPA